MKIKTQKKKGLVPFALASVAVIGIGAAITTAAFTDNVFIGAHVTSGTLDLKASFGEGAPFVDSDDAGNIELHLDPAQLAGLQPGQTRYLGFYVRNESSTPVALTLGSEVVASTFQAPPMIDIAGPATLGASEEAYVNVEVTAPDWTDEDQGQSADFVITIAGEAIVN